MKKGNYWLHKKRPEHSKVMTGKHWKQSSTVDRPTKRLAVRKDFSNLAHKAKIWRVKEIYGQYPIKCDKCRAKGLFQNNRWSISYVNADGEYDSVDLACWRRLCSKCKFVYLRDSRHVVTAVNSR